MYIDIMQLIQPESDAASMPFSEGGAAGGVVPDTGFAQIFSEARLQLVAQLFPEGTLTDDDAAALDWNQAFAAMLGMASPVSPQAIQSGMTASGAPFMEDAPPVAGEAAAPPEGGPAMLAKAVLSGHANRPMEMGTAAMQDSAMAATSTPPMEKMILPASTVATETARSATRALHARQPLVVAEVNTAMASLPETPVPPSTAEYAVTPSPGRVPAAVEPRTAMSAALASEAEYVVLPSLVEKTASVTQKDSTSFVVTAASGKTTDKAAAPTATASATAAPTEDTPMPSVAAAADTPAEDPLPADVSARARPGVDLKQLPPPDLLSSKTSPRQASDNPALFAQTLESDSVVQQVQGKSPARLGEEPTVATDTAPRLTGAATETSSSQAMVNPAAPETSKAAGVSLAAQPQDAGALSGRATLQSLDAFMVKGVRYLAGQGGNTLCVRLIPESLGEMHIEVRRHGDDLSIRLVSANPAVRETLQSNLPGLREALSKDGLEVGQVEIASATSQHSGQGGWNSQQASPQETPVRIPAHYTQRYGNPVQETTPVIRRLSAHQGMLNVFV